MKDITWSSLESLMATSLDHGALLSSPEFRSATRWLELENEVLCLSRLGDDWDGLGATAPNQSLVDNAILFLREIQNENPDAPPLTAIAGPNGEILFAWQDGHSLVEAEIGQSGVAEICRKERGGTAEFSYYHFDRGAFQGHQDDPTWDREISAGHSAVA